MKGLKRLGLAVGAVTAVLAVTAFIAGSVMAVSGSISLSSGSAEPGGTGSVDLSANVPDPGLGAWTVDISYDTAVVSVNDCAPAAGGVCNPEFGDGVIRITGASASGLEGDTSLGTVTFDCADAEAETDLTMSLDVFADATIGDPQDIDATVNDGSFACEIQPTDSPEDPTATPGVAGPPVVGTGSGSADTNWVIVALVGVALASLASLTALRFGARRS